MFVLSTSKLALIATTTTMIMVSSVTAFAPPAAVHQQRSSLTLKAVVDNNDNDDVDIKNDSADNNRRELFKSLPGRAVALSAIAGGLVSGSGIDAIIHPPLAAAAAAAASYPDPIYGPLADLGTCTIMHCTHI